MTITQNREPLTPNRLAAAALAALGAASAIPIPLAQLDFASLFNEFNIDGGDSPQALLVIAGVGGILTIAVLGLAFVGVGLALTGAPAAPLWALAAAHGYGWQMIWLPAAVAGAAWPRDRKHTLNHCLRRLHRQRVESR